MDTTSTDSREGQPHMGSCDAPTIASFAENPHDPQYLMDAAGRPDRNIVVTRDCACPAGTSTYHWTAKVDPIVGERAMTCLGPQQIVASSGLMPGVDGPLPKTGQGWRRLGKQDAA